MPQRFTTPLGRHSTASEVIDGVDLSGRRAIVTGAGSGIGAETARALASAGAEVVLAVRRPQAAGQIAAGIAGSTGNAKVSVCALDLSDLSSVRAFATGVAEPFDVLINNAGVMATPHRETTAQGYERQFGTNHLGHFVFVNRIAGLIKDGGRLVNLTSGGHRYSDVVLDDPNFERTEYTPFAAYGRSKTANVLFAVEFDRRHRGRGVRAAAVHPGAIG